MVKKPRGPRSRTPVGFGSDVTWPVPLDERYSVTAAGACVFSGQRHFKR